MTPASRRIAAWCLYDFANSSYSAVIAATVFAKYYAQAIVGNQAGLGDAFVTLWTWLRWPVLALLLMLVTALVYYVAPNVAQPFRLISPGAVLAVAVWVIASAGFSFYVSSFGNYSATYGSLGGVVVLLLYFYLSSAVLLLGAEVNAELYRTGREATDAGTEPERGAGSPET